MDKDKEGNNNSQSKPSGSQRREILPALSNPQQRDSSGIFSAGVPASPPSFLSLEQLLKAAEDVSKSEFDMALAHEIAVNKDFVLHQKIPKSSLEEQLSVVCHKAFWDLLNKELSSIPPIFSQAMCLLKEIKEILLWLLLPHNARLKNEIQEVLDLELIEQQAKHGSLDFLKYGGFIISMMALMCAPARDSAVQNLRLITEIVPLYKGILETLDLLKLDMVNFTISHMRPHIQQHSIEYEKKKFQEIIQSFEGLALPVDGLKFTRQWLQDVYLEIQSDSSNKIESNATILKKAYLRTLTWTETENFPETLHLDHTRFIRLRDNLAVLSMTASVALVTYSNVGQSIQDIADFKQSLKNHIQVILEGVPLCSSEDLSSHLESVGVQVVKEVNECLEKHGYSTLLEENNDTLMASIKSLANKDHAVRKLITKRVLEFLELALTTTATLKVPAGLSTFSKELSSLAGQFVTLVKHNQSVFDEYYNDIIDKCKSVQ